MNEEERKNIPEWMIPDDIKNLTYCGGGATIFLNRKKVSDQIKTQLKNIEKKYIDN